ncbi:hypothetical protein C1A23_00145 (plasmid) [Aeromonas hydrophila subsp. hydrophila]|nr:hypothetical protein C1A23_00145 [Aeromonas hydrophila subsp. hydrophila]
MPADCFAARGERAAWCRRGVAEGSYALACFIFRFLRRPPCGQRLCDLTEMQLLDFGGRISVEGGLLNFDLDAAEWRERLITLGLEPH